MSSDTPALTPGILLGVSGTAKHRIVVGSLQIVQELPWPEKEGGLVEVPVHPHSELDFAQLRGRRLEQELVTFGGIKPLFFKIL